MDLRAANDSELRFVGYVEGLVSVIGHAIVLDRCVTIALA